MSEIDALKALAAYNVSKPGQRRGKPKPTKIYKDDVIDLVTDLLLLVERELHVGKDVLELSRRHFLREIRDAKFNLLDSNEELIE